MAEEERVKQARQEVKNSPDDEEEDEGHAQVKSSHDHHFTHSLHSLPSTHRVIRAKLKTPATPLPPHLTPAKEAKTLTMTTNLPLARLNSNQPALPMPPTPMLIPNP